MGGFFGENRLNGFRFLWKTRSASLLESALMPIHLKSLERIFLSTRMESDNLESLSDEALMARFQKKCERSFTLLMERYQHSIHSFLYRFINDKGFAEDLTQEVFLRVYQRGATFRLDAKFSTWLYRIARNLAIDFNKRKPQAPKLLLSHPSSSQSDEDPPLVEQLAGPIPTAEQSYLNQELGSHIETAISTLPEKYREVFILCSIQELSYEEASLILRCPVKTVSSRLCRAKVKFLKAMEKYLHLDPPNRFFL